MSHSFLLSVPMLSLHGNAHGWGISEGILNSFILNFLTDRLRAGTDEKWNE